MTEIYGEQWVRQFGDEPSSAWRQELGRLTERQLRAGVQRVIKERMEWPPNLIKFLDLCDNAEPPLDSYRRFMSGEKYLDYAERQTRNLIGWDCKNRLSADKAEKLWIETITRIRREQAEEEREVAQLAHSQSLQIGADNDSTR